MVAPRVNAGLRYSPLAALVALVLYGLTETPFSTRFLEIFAVGSMSFGAAFGVGAVVGFLFGIPRRLQREDIEPAAGGALLVNTNLEQISDWLTKIIVGVGLVEIGRLVSGLDAVADLVMLGDGSGAHAFALGLLIYALVDGFLLSYVWTRLELSAQLALADALLQPLPPPPPPLPPPPPPPASASASAS